MNDKEKFHKIENCVREILENIGEDLNREGLKETPSRVAKEYSEIFSGYQVKPEEVLNKKFFEKPNFSEYIWLKKIEFHSMCEHHMLPISGFVDICYIPRDSVVGLSKLARIVDVFAKRLQLQERLCFQIAESIQENLNPLGVGVRIRAKHYCMLMRGSKKQDSFMETTYFTGVFRNQNVNTNTNTNQSTDNNNVDIDIDRNTYRSGDVNIEKNVENSYRREFFASLVTDSF